MCIFVFPLCASGFGLAGNLWFLFGWTLYMIFSFFELRLRMSQEKWSGPARPFRPWDRQLASAPALAQAQPQPFLEYHENSNKTKCLVYSSFFPRFSPFVKPIILLRPHFFFFSFFLGLLALGFGRDCGQTWCRSSFVQTRAGLLCSFFLIIYFFQFLLYFLYHFSPNPVCRLTVQCLDCYSSCLSCRFIVSFVMGGVAMDLMLHNQPVNWIQWVFGLLLVY